MSAAPTCSLAWPPFPTSIARRQLGAPIPAPGLPLEYDFIQAPGGTTTSAIGLSKGYFVRSTVRRVLLMRCVTKIPPPPPLLVCRRCLAAQTFVSPE